MRNILCRAALAGIVILAFNGWPARRNKCRWIVHSRAGIGCIARTVLRRR